MTHPFRRHILRLALVMAALLPLTAGLTGCRGPKLATANEQMERGEYSDAAKTYRKLYNKWTKREERPQRGMVAFKMAECYRKLNMTARASAAYQNALRYGYPDSTAMLHGAQMLQGEGKYAQAVKMYEDYLALDPENAEARLGLASASQAAELKKRKTRYVVRQDRLLNSRRSDYAPMFNGAEQVYYTTTNEKVTGDKRSEITGTKKPDIWFARKNEQGQWQRPEPVEGELNSDVEEGVAAFSPDGSTMYLTRARREPNSSTSVEIYTSQRSDAQWSKPVKFDITADTLSAYAHPAVSPNGKYLYFTSDMPGGSGGRDIWRIRLDERVGSLENLGEDINTVGDEMFPYLLTDSLMYFSSTGHPGLGGLDIFSATLGPDGHWTVKNMGAPLNSEGDDFGITFEPGASVPRGFFSSNRGDGRGYDHIYTFELPDLKINISGWVVDMDEEPVPGAVIRIVGNDGTNRKAVARNDGYFTFPLNRGVDYVMLAGAKGFLNARQAFTSDSAEEDAEYEIDFMLASLNKPNIVENIFYDFDSATLRPESAEALDELVTLLNDNPNITIEMASHTDRHGSDEYNLDLSERRAKSVIDYLIEHGIAADRLQHTGFGRSRPMTVTKRVNSLYPQFPEGTLLNEEFVLSLPEEADREAADQINRRTEFSVLSVNYNLY